MLILCKKLNAIYFFTSRPVGFEANIEFYFLFIELSDVSMYLNEDVAPTTYLVPSTVSDLAQYLSEDILDEEHNFFDTTSDKLTTLDTDTQYNSLESNTSTEYSWETQQSKSEALHTVLLRTCWRLMYNFEVLFNDPSMHCTIMSKLAP